MQRLTFEQTVLVIWSQDASGNFANAGVSDNPGTIKLEVLCPVIDSRVEEANKLPA